MTPSLDTGYRVGGITIQDFTRRFGQAIQQVVVYNMNAILHNSRKSFAPSTMFFHSLSLDPPTIMEELYRREDRYSTLADNIRAATQTVIIIRKPTRNSKPEGKKQPESGQGQGKNRKRPQDQPQGKREPRNLLN